MNVTLPADIHHLTLIGVFAKLKPGEGRLSRYDYDRLRLKKGVHQRL